MQIYIAIKYNSMQINVRHKNKSTETQLMIFKGEK